MKHTVSPDAYRAGKKTIRRAIEVLESRVLMSGATHDLFGAIRLSATSPQPYSSGHVPSQIRMAYGVNAIKFGNIVGDGSGQTIAIIDAYDTPTISHDLHAFDAQFGLPDPPSFRRVAQDGSTKYPSVDPQSKVPGGNDWESETALDVEWAHAIAPKASILLVEASDDSYANLFTTAPNYARHQPGVSVVSMSFGDDETNYAGSDATYTTPAGHAGVTFIASSGDNGAYSADGSMNKVPSYPASSPNVLSIGGTTLNLYGNSAYKSETTWGHLDSQNPVSFLGTGGGISSIELQPVYQAGIVSQSRTFRTVPDVAMDADPNTGVNVYDSFNGGAHNPWAVIGGTSLAAPMWAGLIAIADQGRVVNHLTPLDGAGQTLPLLYGLPGSDFHDITQGNNGGYHAGAGYDLTTGRGSPIANLVVPALAIQNVTPQPPVIASVTASLSPVVQGTSTVLTANGAQALGGYVAYISFYRESNHIAGLQIGTGGDTLVASDTNSSDGWTASVSTSALTPGAYTYYARAITAGGLASPTGAAAKSAAVTVLKAGTAIGPMISYLAASASTIANANSSFTLTAAGVADIGGGSIVRVDFYLEFNNTPGLQTNSTTGDFLDSSATDGSHGWTDQVSPDAEFGPLSGTYTFYAVATDTKGRVSPPVAVQVSYTGGSTPATYISRLSASATTVAPGAKVTLTASGLHDVQGFPSYIIYYRESNNTAGLQPGSDVQVGQDLHDHDPSSIQIIAPTAAGTYTYYAQFCDDDGVFSPNGTKAVKVVITVT